MELRDSPGRKGETDDECRLIYADEMSLELEDGERRFAIKKYGTKTYGQRTAIDGLWRPSDDDTEGEEREAVGRRLGIG